MPEQTLDLIYVGDDQDNYGTIADALAGSPEHGLNLTRFEHMDEALEYAEANSPDAVLLDLELSDLKEDVSLRALPDLFTNLPIVVFFGAEPDEDTLEAVDALTKDYLVKEQLTGQLVSKVVRQAVERGTSQARMRHTREALEDWVKQRTQDLTEANKALQMEVEERKRAQHELAESRRMLAMVTDNIPALVAFVDKDRRYRFANRRYETLLGRSLDNIIGAHVRDALGEHYPGKVEQHIEAALAGRTVGYELEFASGESQEPRWLQITYIPFLNDQNAVEGYFVLGSDVTERKQNEDALREHRRLLQNILDGMGAAVFFIDADEHVITEANEIAEVLTGLPRREIVGSKWEDLIRVSNPAKQEDEGAEIGAKSLNKEMVITRRDGQNVPVTKSLLPVTIAGQPHHVAILFDMTERKAMERQLAYAQKLESVGQLAAGIAHEINTPIQYIGNNLQFLKQIFEQLAPILSANPNLAACLATKDEDEPPAEDRTRLVESLLDEVPQALEESLEGVERVAGIVLAMKKFSHPDVEEWKHVDLNDAVKSTVTITRNEWKHVADVVTDLDGGLPLISVVPGDINQVILNLLVNAAHAIRDKTGGQGGKGTITIRTRALDDDKVELSVTDTGIGIPEDNRTRIFDPFFTTKEVGTGQGLAITLSVIEKHGGSIDFESAPGQGTTFTVRLPREPKRKEPS